MWELDYKESWALKNWCFWTVVLEKILESALDFQEVKPVNPKGNQSWIFIHSFIHYAKAETPIIWPSDMKNWLIWKDPDAGKDWRREAAENEMVGCHHQLDGHEFELTSRVGDGQESLVCCSPRGHRESVMIGRLNSTELNQVSPTVFRNREVSLNWMLMSQTQYFTVFLLNESVVYSLRVFL